MNIVYTYVCGDIIHKGHIVYLQNAKSFGDKLVVGVLTDNAVKEKKYSPIISFEERCDIVSNIIGVDMVVTQKDYSPVNNIRNIKPDIMVESESHSIKLLNTVRTVTEMIGCRLIILPYWDKQSSTKIKDVIRNKMNE